MSSSSDKSYLTIWKHTRYGAERTTSSEHADESFERPSPGDGLLRQ